MEPRTGDIRREAPIPKPEELPLIRGPIPPASGNNKDDDDDDDYYPSYDFGTQSTKNDEAVSKQAPKSTIINPTAPVMEPEPAATGVTTSSLIVMGNTNFPPVMPLIIPSEPKQLEDEVSLGDKDPVKEAMGPQIPAELPVEDVVMRESVAVVEDPLEFATSCPMIYGIPLSVDFKTVQTIVTNLAAQLHLSVCHIFRISVR